MSAFPLVDAFMGVVMSPLSVIAILLRILKSGENTQELIVTLVIIDLIVSFMLILIIMKFDTFLSYLCNIWVCPWVLHRTRYL
jgi:mannitol-specific phosphotransferase system IIBC component